MANLNRVPDGSWPPSISKRFTSFASQLVLWNGTVAPSSIERMPNQVLIEHDVGDVFSYIDEGGSAVAITFPAAGVTVIRMSPKSIETATTANGVTVFWHAR